MQKIIIDTDLGADCDDVGALALAHILQDEGHCHLLGVTYTTTLKNGPIAIDIINQYFNNIVPIGINTDKHYFDGANTDLYVSKLVKHFFNYRRVQTPFVNSVKLLRKLLSENDNVTLICIGQLNNLAKLYESKSDEISLKSGKELIKDSLAKIVIMGGLFKNDNQTIYFHGTDYGNKEYNIVSDIEASKTVIENLNVKTYFIDFILGYKVFTGQRLCKYMDVNPVGFAYQTYNNGPRESWDLLAVYYGIMGDNQLLKASKSGDVTLENGVTRFKENECGYSHIIQANVCEEVLQEEIDKLLNTMIKEE